jgi:hypothetical protein
VGFAGEKKMRLAKLRNLDKLARRILIGTLLFELGLVAVYWFDALNHGRYQLVHALFDLDGEANIPAWFSSAQLLLIALTFWTTALRRPHEQQGTHPSRAFLALAGCAAAYVSMDESAQIHEQVTAWMGRRYVDWLPRFTLTHFWIVMVVVAIVVTLFQIFMVDLKAIWREHRTLALIGAVGIGVGLTGGMVVETLGYKLLHGVKDTLWYKGEVTVEEFMEMCGASLILFSVLKLRGALSVRRREKVRRPVDAAARRTPSFAGA